jgi:hypothetical protein
MSTPALRAFTAAVRRRDDWTCEPGLGADELRRAEQHFGLAMAPLWREVLQVVHPVQLPEPPRDADGILRWTRVPDWRLRDLEGTAFLIDGPVEGALFDVEYNEVWLPDWGARPTSLDEALDLARAELGRSPLLTPLWNHLYAGPSDDSPVVSIVQTDILVVADTLTEFIERGLDIEVEPSL